MPVNRLKERVSKKVEDACTDDFILNDDDNNEEEALTLLLLQSAKNSLSSIKWKNKMLLPAILLSLVFWCLLFELSMTWIFSTESDGDPHPDDGVSVLAHCDVRNYNTTFDEFMTQIRGITTDNDTNPNEYFCKGVRTINRHCGCTQPTLARPGLSLKWFEAFDWLKEIAANASALQPLHVALLGDSIFDRWNGRLALTKDFRVADVHKVFQELFTIQGGGQINGISLGLAADVSPNLLYRIQNDDLIGDLHPKVFWQLIGTNDMGLLGCNVEAIVAANIAIAEELLNLRPNSTTIVVINSILPRKLDFYWKYLKEVNKRLECYAAMTDRVEFFDATKFFLSPDGSSLEHLPDGLHPDVTGYRLWGEAIVQKVLELTQAKTGRASSSFV